MRRWLVVCILSGLVMVPSFCWSRPVMALDLWYEMAVAREILEIGSVARTNSFAYTPTNGTIAGHEWGTGMVALRGVGRFGFAVIVSLEIFSSISFAGLCWICVQRSGSGTSFLSLLSPLAIFLAAEGFSPIRAHLYSFVSTAVLLNRLDLDRTDKHWWMVVWLPLFVLCWKVHDRFRIGAGLYALHWPQQAVRRKANWHVCVWALVMLGLIGANRYLHVNYSCFAHAVTMARLNVSEWASQWFANPSKIGLFLLSIAMLAYGLVYTVFARLAGWLVVWRLGRFPRWWTISTGISCRHLCMAKLRFR